MNTIQLIAQNRKHIKVCHLITKQKKQRAKYTFSKSITPLTNLKDYRQFTFWKRKQKQMLSFLSKLNKEIVLKEYYETTNLSRGDMVEIIHFVGGG